MYKLLIRGISSGLYREIVVLYGWPLKKVPLYTSLVSILPII